MAQIGVNKQQGATNQVLRAFKKNPTISNIILKAFVSSILKFAKDIVTSKTYRKALFYKLVSKLSKDTRKKWFKDKAAIYELTGKCFYVDELKSINLKGEACIEILYDKQFTIIVAIKNSIGKTVVLEIAIRNRRYDHNCIAIYEGKRVVLYDSNNNIIWEDVLQNKEDEYRFNKIFPLICKAFDIAMERLFIDNDNKHKEAVTREFADVISVVKKELNSTLHFYKYLLLFAFALPSTIAAYAGLLRKTDNETR